MSPVFLVAFYWSVSLQLEQAYSAECVICINYTLYSTCWTLHTARCQTYYGMFANFNAQGVAMRIQVPRTTPIVQSRAPDLSYDDIIFYFNSA